VDLDNKIKSCVNELTDSFVKYWKNVIAKPEYPSFAIVKKMQLEKDLGITYSRIK